MRWFWRWRRLVCGLVGHDMPPFWGQLRQCARCGKLEWWSH